MVRTLPVALGLVLLCALAVPAFAKDICLHLDDGPEEGSEILLKGVNVAARKFGPVHGYLAHFNSAVGAFTLLRAVEGQAMVRSNRILVLGLTVHEAFLTAISAGTTASPSVAINLTCGPGEDGQLDSLDLCTGVVSGESTHAHIIDCDDVVPIP